MAILALVLATEGSNSSKHGIPCTRWSSSCCTFRNTENSRDGDDESRTCSVASGLDVLSVMELCDEIFYKLKWLSWPCTCQITSPT